MTGEMNIKYGKLAIVVNRLRRDELPERIEEIREITKADFVIGMPDCGELAEIAEKGGSIMNISADNKIVRLVDDLLEQAGLPGRKPA